MPSRLPLFDLPRMRELESMEAERNALADRIQGLPKNSHKRVILQERLRQLTHRQLQAETELEARQ